MATRVRSYSKINLGLAIGPVRPDGFHGLTTLYQTLDLHDLVTVSAKRSSESRIALTTKHPFVPRDARNTAWRMVERCLERLGIAAEVTIHIEKRLPVQGGRGEQVVPMPDLPRTWCVVAVPQIGVSTPAAFKAWDALVAANTAGAKAPYSKEEIDSTAEAVPLTRQARTATDEGTTHEDAGILYSAQDDDKLGEELTSAANPDRLNELNLAYSSLSAKTGDCKPGTSGIVRDPNPEKKRDLPDESQADAMNDLAENALLALVRTGIGNDFEQVVFPQYPSLRITKRQLMGSDSDGLAIYAALSGSGSALFGLYRSEAEAKAAQQRVQSSGVQALLTETLPRAEYWERMFAE